MRIKRKRRTIIFNVDVARRRKPGTGAGRGAEPGGRERGKLALIGVGVLAVCVLAAALLSGRFPKPSGFTVRWIEVSNEELLSKERIRALAGIKGGDNLFSADLQKIRARVCAHPDIRDAMVSRRMPGGVLIRVHERFPVAAIYCPPLSPARQFQGQAGLAAGLFEGERMRRCVVDAEGVVLSARKERNSRSLPVLIGLKLGAVRPGDRLCSAAAKHALGIVEQYRGSELCRQMELVSVDVGDPDNYLMRSNVVQEIRLGNENLGERLRLLSFILAQRKYRGLDCTARYIDLRWKDVAELPLAKDIVARK